MKTIAIQAIPNQAFTVNLDSERFNFTIKETRGCMSVSITRDDIILVENIRMVAGTPLIPFKYLQEGNFFLITESQELPYYTQFGVTQQLVYLTIDEVNALIDEGIIQIPSYKPSLSFNFLSLPRLISAEGFTATFTRASSATYFNQNGLLISASNNVPRFDYDPISGDAKGLLRESPGTNLSLHSEEFDDATWTKSNSSISVNAAVAPDGSSSADKLIDTSSNTTHIETQSGSFISGSTYTFSVFLAQAGRTDAWLFLPVGAFSGNPYCFVNLLTGTLGTPNGCTAKIQKLPGNFYRVSITAIASATTSGNYGIGTAIGIALADATYVGDGVGGIYTWGSQVELNAYPTSYIKTIASTVTRANELITVDSDGWLAERLGTLIADVQIPFSGLVAKQIGVELSDISAANSLSYFIDGTDSNKKKQLLTAVSVTQYSYVSTAYGFINPTISATAYQLNSVNGAIDGILGTPDAVAAIPDFTQLTIGSDYTGNNGLNGWIREIAYYSQVLPNDLLHTITE